MADEKKPDVVSCTQSDEEIQPDDIDVGTAESLKNADLNAEAEVFGATGEGQVNFRTVGWIRASMFLMKQTFATGVLSMPSAMYYLGGVPSAIFIVFWGLVNTRSAYIQGEYKLAHPRMHTVIDGAEMSIKHLTGSRVWSKVAKYIAAYAVALPGLIAVGMISVHVPAKTLFVRVLRNTHHLTENTKTHWIVWFACTLTCGFLGWLLAVAIPFYTSLVSLIGSMGFGPLGVVVPPFLWFSLNINARTGTPREQMMFWAHIGMLILGLFLTIGGTYANISNIIDQFRAGKVGTAFSCADNSATVVGA